ncbi:hypothetical protein BC830DRAFT_1108001 [Chytriomyces sp. MP71]|nr:hypothetical protein BC830DRAFT_1108001 [Chytriomyces sp. MP71]
MCFTWVLDVDDLFVAIWYSSLLLASGVACPCVPFFFISLANRVSFVFIYFDFQNPSITTVALPILISFASLEDPTFAI